MNEIKIFENPEFGKIQVIMIDEKPYFAGSDVARILGYARPRKAVIDHCKHILKRDGVSLTTNQYGVTTEQTVEMSFISESDVYRLIMKSNLPNAEKFQDWVVEEVLPSIREHGAYMTPETIDAIADNPDLLIQLAQKLKAEREKIKQLNLEIEKNRPATLTGQAVESSTNGILIGQYAPRLQEAGWDIGSSRLFKEFREDGFLCSQKGLLWNKPSQFCLENGYMKYRTSIYTNSKGEQQTSYTPLVTGKGQVYFLNYYKNKYGF